MLFTVLMLRVRALTCNFAVQATRQWGLDYY
jgi:hypothetical protein